MRILGLDLGSKTLGVSVSDALGMIARPVETIRFESDDYEAACKQVQPYIKEFQVKTAVLGLPKHMNGDVGIRGEISLMLDSSSLYVTDENGNEKRMEILFTFEDDNHAKKYVVFMDPEEEEGEVFASAYDDEGNLIPVESDAEWQMIEEVIGAFQEDEEAVEE